MRILIVPSEHYVTQAAPLSGIFQYDQAHALERHGMEVGVISAGYLPWRRSFGSSSYPPRELDGRVPTYRHYERLPLPGRLALSLLWKRLVRAYLHLFSSFRAAHWVPDVLHAHNCLYAGAAALEIRRRFGIPYVLTEHSSAYARGQLGKKQLSVARSAFGNADVRSAVSTSLGVELTRQLGSAGVQPIYNMVASLFERSPLPSTARVGPDRFGFLNVANLDENKDHATLLRAFARAFQDSPNVTLRVGGGGPLLETLQAQATTLGIQEQVSFLGMLTREEVLREMSSCQAFVLSSRVETFGLVLAEAMALGLPVVATDSGGPRDIVTEATGTIVPVGDVAALALAMSEVRAARASYSPERIRASCLSRFGEDAFVANLTSLYAQALNRRRSL